MKPTQHLIKKSRFALVTVSIALLFQACMPSSETGENLVEGDILDPDRNEIDIYVINENTLYGLRDNNRPSLAGNGSMEPFFINAIPGYVPVSSPIFSVADVGNGSWYAGNYGEVGLLISSTDGVLYHYDLPSGILQWTTNLGGTCSASPSTTFEFGAIDNDMIAVGTNNGQVHLISVGSGEIMATYVNPNGAGFDAKVNPNPKASAIIAGATDGFVYAIRYADGSLLGRYDTGAPILASPFISTENDVFVGNRDGQLFRLSHNLSDLRWRTQLSGTIHAEPIEGTDVLFVTTTDGWVYQINKQTGDIDWQFQADAAIYSSIGAEFENADRRMVDLLYFTSTDGNVYALNRSGGLQWKTNLGDGQLFATPILAKIRVDYHLYVNTINGVYGLNASTGKVFSNFAVTHGPNSDASGNFKSSPAVFSSIAE